MFSPEKDLARKIVECLGKDGLSISSLDKELTAQGVKNHRLVLTGYLRALTDLGYLRVRDVPPAKIYVPAARLPESVYQSIERHARALKGVDSDEVIFYCLSRMFKRPIFESELRLCGINRPLGQKATEEETAEARKLLRRDGNVVPSENAYVPGAEYPAEYDTILAEIVIEDRDSKHLVQDTRQTRLLRAAQSSIITRPPFVRAWRCRP